MAGTQGLGFLGGIGASIGVNVLGRSRLIQCRAFRTRVGIVGTARPHQEAFLCRTGGIDAVGGIALSGEASMAGCVHCAPVSLIPLWIVPHGSLAKGTRLAHRIGVGCGRAEPGEGQG